MEDPDKCESAAVQELLHPSQQMGVKLWPCDMTMDMMGLASRWSSSPPTAFPVRMYRPGPTTWV